MITHKVIGASSVRARLAAASVLIQNQLRNPDGAAELVVDRIKRRFLSQVDPTGRPWAPLKAATVERRRRSKIGAGKGILYHSGELYNSIQRIRSGGFATATGFGFRVGVPDTQAKKARAHQYGTGRIPKRQFLGVSDLDVRSVTAYLGRQIKEGLAGA